MHTVPMRNEEELTQGSRKVTGGLYTRDTVNSTNLAVRGKG